MTRLVKQLIQEESAVKRGNDLMPLLDAHLGGAADELPVVVETISAHRWADTDIALASVTARDPEATLVGVGGGDQRHHSSLGDLMANAEWGRFRSGQVDHLNVATGPDTERATVAFGLHLFRHDGVPLAVLQRVGNPQYGSESRLEVLAPIRTRPPRSSQRCARSRCGRACSGARWSASVGIPTSDRCPT